MVYGQILKIWKSRAMEYLRSAINAQKMHHLPYISDSFVPTNIVINSSPSKYYAGLLTSNINLFPQNVKFPAIKDLDLSRPNSLEDANVRAYIQSPLSNIVDGDTTTYFRSPNGEPLEF